MLIPDEYHGVKFLKRNPMYEYPLGLAVIVKESDGAFVARHNICDGLYQICKDAKEIDATRAFIRDISVSHRRKRDGFIQKYLTIYAVLYK